MTLQEFPLGYLELAPENPRQSVAEAHIDRLAANIAAQGLKQNLVGYIGESGETTTVFITAGGCRLRALRKLDQDGDLDLALIPVRIEPQDMAVATALSENVVRIEMGQAERVRAYKELHDEGLSSDAVMAMYGLSRKAYSNTMKIADLPEPILDALAAGEMTWDHAAGFACGDPGRALEFFEAVKGKGFGTGWPRILPHAIRNHMTEEKVKPNDRLAKFVGRKAYEKRGTITEDLFSEDVFFDDPQLLNDMALAKLTKAGGKLRKEWAWVEPVVEAPDYTALRAYGRTYGEEVELTEAESTEYDELAELANGDVIDKAGKARLEELMDKLETVTWSDAQRQIAGAIVTIGYGGKPDITAGLVRPDDVAAAIEAGVMQANKHMPEAAKADDKDPLDYSAALSADLSVTIHRTAMQCEMLEKPDKLLEILSANLRGTMTTQRLDLTGYPTTRISDALIEQGFTPDPRLVDAWKGHPSKGGKGKAKRDATITAALACRLEHHKGYNPKIRDWWTPTEAFFRRLTKAQLIDVACEIHAGHLTKWDQRKKTEIVTILATAFDGTLIAANGAVTPELQKAIKAAKSWLPPVLRPVEAKMEEAA